MLFRSVDVKGFKAKGRPITNEEYAKYLSETGSDTLPASWNSTAMTNGTNGATNGSAGSTGHFDKFLEGKAVRTVYGSVPLKYALHWPVSACYDELAGCATYMGGRIPTME